MLPLRVKVDCAEGFRALVRKARDTFLGAMAHAHTSVDELAEQLPGFEPSSQRRLSRRLFNFLPLWPSASSPWTACPAAADRERLQQVRPRIRRPPVPARGPVPVLPRDPSPRQHRGVAAAVRRAAGRRAEDPDRPLGETAGWSAADREIVDRANDTADRPPYPLVPVAFATHAANEAQAAAVTEGEHTLSYQDVHEQADAIRSMLASAGIRAGDVVAAAVPRAQAAAAALGVWRAGAVLLLLLDPDTTPPGSPGRSPMPVLPPS